MHSELPSIMCICPNTDGFIPMFIDPSQTMAPPKEGVKKMKFTPEEDQKLFKLINKYGTSDWMHISEMMKTRNPRQCRERWNNYLNPKLSDEPWTTTEDFTLIAKYKEFGTHWGKISKFLKNRSSNAIRNRWNFLLKKSISRTAQNSSDSS